MASQANLARSFENGATSGKASSVEIREIEGGSREYLGDWLEGRDPTGIGQNVSQVNK